MKKVYLILLATLASVIPIIFIKKFADTNEKKFIFFAIIAYAVAIYAFIHLFKEGRYEVYKSITNIMLIVIIILIAVTLYYNKTYTTKKIIGLILAVVVIILLRTDE